jgi:hypothetical protein
VVQSIVSSTRCTLEARAYHLLSLASKYLDGLDIKSSDVQFTNVGNSTYLNRECANLVVPWAEMISAERYLKTHASTYTEETSTKTPVLSRESLELANLLFIASRLFEKAGNKSELLKCNKIVKASASLLTSFAYDIVPMSFPDVKPAGNQWARLAISRVFTEDEYKESAKLKLRAAALTDRLDSTSDERRMAHRNLALWYLQIGDLELADKQKQILFKLVHIEHDSIFYPQSLACGEIVWWRTPAHKDAPVFMCGMG